MSMRKVAVVGYYVAFAIAGGLLGLVPIVLFQFVSQRLSACLLPVLPSVGLGGGLLLAAVLGGRIERRGGQRAIIGATLLVLLFSCFTCNAVQGIAAFHDVRQVQQMEQRALEMGLPVPKSAPRTRPPWWVILPMALAYGAVCVMIVAVSIYVMFPNRKSSKPTPEVAEDEDVTLVDPDY